MAHDEYPTDEYPISIEEVKRKSDYDGDYDGDSDKKGDRLIMAPDEYPTDEYPISNAQVVKNKRFSWLEKGNPKSPRKRFDLTGFAGNIEAGTGATI